MRYTLIVPFRAVTPEAGRNQSSKLGTTHTMRILLVNDAISKELPGGSRFAADELAKALVLRGHEVTLLVPRQMVGTPEVEIDHGLRTVRYDGAGQGWQFVRSGCITAFKLLQTSKFDIVHVHSAYAALGPLSVIPKIIPRVRTFHGPWDEESYIEDVASSHSPLGVAKASSKRWIRRIIEQQNLTNSDAIITLSECFREKVTKRYGVPTSKVIVIPGGANMKRFVPTPDKADKRLSLGLPADRRILLTIRRLAPRMGLDNLVTAMQHVANVHPDMLLLIGGAGPLRSQIEQRIIELKLQDHVRLVGFIPDEQLASYYQSADLFILPTTALEGFGLVTVEALACGLLVIGTPIGGTSEILTRLDPHFLTKGTSPEDLADGIFTFFQSKRREEFGPKRLNDFVRKNYTWEKHTEEVEQVYKKLLRQP